MLLGAWHLVGPAHLLATLVKAHLWACLLKPHKISFWFNAKLMQDMSNTLKEERKERSKRQEAIRPCGELKQTESHIRPLWEKHKWKL